MPRHARIDNIGLLQHVIFRGIERKYIFFGDEDREDFIARFGVVFFLAIRINKLTGGEVGRWLSYTSSATSRAVKRGREIFDVDDKLKELAV